MFTLKFMKEIEDEWVTYVYSCRYYTHSEQGKFVLYGFNGNSEDEAVIYVNDAEANYKRVYIMNEQGKTIDHHVVNTDLKSVSIG